MYVCIYVGTGMYVCMYVAYSFIQWEYYVASLQDNYSEALPAQPRWKNSF